MSKNFSDSQDQENVEEKAKTDSDDSLKIISETEKRMRQSEEEVKTGSRQDNLFPKREKKGTSDAEKNPKMVKDPIAIFAIIAIFVILAVMFIASTNS